MAYARPSTTTASGTPPRKRGVCTAGQAQRPCRNSRPTRGALPVVLTLAVILTLLTAGASGGCVDSPVTHIELVPGLPASADLDGDGALESALIDPTEHYLSITDGAVYYRSRHKWRVVQAVLGDADGDGLTEVITLLDSAKGRHLGLFAYYGGEYRERLVTQIIDPAPVAFEVVGDSIVIVQEDLPGRTGLVRTLLRWNGFGFTRIETSGEE